MKPVFLLALVDARDGHTIVSAPGNIKLEADLAAEVLARLKGESIGFFTSRADVEQAIVTAIESVGMDLRRRSILAMQGQ